MGSRESLVGFSRITEETLQRRLIVFEVCHHSCDQYRGVEQNLHTPENPARRTRSELIKSTMSTSESDPPSNTRTPRFPTSLDSCEGGQSFTPSPRSSISSSAPGNKFRRSRISLGIKTLPARSMVIVMGKWYLLVASPVEAAKLTNCLPLVLQPSAFPGIQAG